MRRVCGHAQPDRRYHHVSGSDRRGAGFKPAPTVACCDRESDPVHGIVVIIDAAYVRILCSVMDAGR